jgi:DNA-binding HxlR family transcriptional regulator
METKMMEKMCPIDCCMLYIGKKWGIQIIRDLINGKKRFKDFLQSNKDLTTKVLSERLKELEKNGIINKSIVSTTPISIEYSLTEKGKGLKGVLKEMMIFSQSQCPEMISCTLEETQQLMKKLKE